jgi:hypothetical protein
MKLRAGPLVLPAASVVRSCNTKDANTMTTEQIAALVGNPYQF